MQHLAPRDALSTPQGKAASGLDLAPRSAYHGTLIAEEEEAEMISFTQQDRAEGCTYELRRAPDLGHSSPLQWVDNVPNVPRQCQDEMELAMEIERAYDDAQIAAEEEEEVMSSSIQQNRAERVCMSHDAPQTPATVDQTYSGSRKEVEETCSTTQTVPGPSSKQPGKEQEAPQPDA